MSLAIKAGLIQRNWKWLVVGFPRFEFAGHVVPPPRRAQFGDDAGMLCREPVPKLVKRFDGRENGGGDFNGFRFHGGSLSRFIGKGKGFPLSPFRNRSSRRKEAPYFLQFEPRYLGCYGVLKEPPFHDFSGKNYFAGVCGAGGVGVAGGT